MGVLPWLLALGGGIVAAPYGSFSVWLTALGLGCALPVFLLRRHPRLRTAAAALFFFLGGYLLCGLALEPLAGPRDLRSWCGAGEVLVEAEVLSLGRRDGGKGYLDLRVRSVQKDLQVWQAEGRLRLFVDGPVETVLPGDGLRFRASLRAPHNFGTPGEFDYPRYLAARGIQAGAYLNRLEDAAILPGEAGLGPRYLTGIWRQRVLSLIEDAVAADTAALLAALLVGDKGGLSDAQRQVLARGGISHLFSISGLHLGLIGFYAYQLVHFFWRRSTWLLLHLPPKRYLPLFLLPVLLVYLLLTGEALPTQRAFLMAAAGAALWVCSRRTAPLNLLWSAALIFLLFEPLLLFEASFQLSFAGVLGIMLLVPRWSKSCPRRPFILRRLCLLLLTTLAATLATLPLTLLHFHLLAPAALLTNLVAVPMIGLVAVPLGLAAVVLTLFWDAGARVLLQLDGLVVQGTFDAMARLVELPLLGGRLLYLTPRALLGVFVLCLLVLAGHQWCRRRRSIAAIAGCLLLLIPSASWQGLEVIALSVGQGDATLLSLAPGRHILVDGGGLRSETFDVGTRLLAPALGHLGVKRLAAVVLTHDHPDHRKGLHQVLSHFEVEEFWAPAPLAELDTDLVRLLDERAIRVRHFAPGWTVIEREHQSLAVFQAEGRGLSLNDRSLVIHAAQGQEGVLLTADLEERGVGELLLHPLPGAVSLLKLPHHGSARSRVEHLLAAAQPSATFVSAGRHNVYRLPARRVVDGLARENIPLYRTDTQGTLRMRTQGKGWAIEHWSKGRFRRPDGAFFADQFADSHAEPL